MFKANNNEVIKDNNNKKADRMVVTWFKSKKLENAKFKICIKIRAIKKPIF